MNSASTTLEYSNTNRNENNYENKSDSILQRSSSQESLSSDISAQSTSLETVRNWEVNKQKDVYDDGTLTFFWRAHTLTTLFVFSGVLIYVALFEQEKADAIYNIKRGLIAVVLAFLLLGVTYIPDGPFKRPHPAVWRFVFCISVVYELSLIFILFQSASDARELMKHFDPLLGQSLDEKDYGGTCVIYDVGHKDPLHNVRDKMDVFVPLHFFGWWIKTLMIRDWWLCTIVSVMFELMEYTLECQLPNFSECWWDHWILDAFLCNGLGIFFGMKTLNYLKMKSYNWRGLWSIPTYRGKLRRIAAQFGPYSWIEFDWKATSSFRRWIAVLIITFELLIAELNTFYLKFVLWLPPPHYLNLVRVLILASAGAVGLRETFQYLEDPTCNKFGRQAWVVIAIILTEFLVIAKFDWSTITLPLPKHIIWCWKAGIIILCIWTIYYFFIWRSTSSTINRKTEKKNN